MENTDSNRDQFIDLYDAVYRNDLSNIPVDAVGPAGTFGDDYQVHRSVGDVSGKVSVWVLHRGGILVVVVVVWTDARDCRH